MSESLQDRLRRLRRELVPGADPPAPAARPPLPPWLRERLAREGQGQRPAASTHRHGVGPPRDLAPQATAEGPLWVRRCVLDAAHRHGDVALEDARGAQGAALALLSGGRIPADFDAARAVYLDIETTGLAGGSGTHVYLVGLGWFEERSFVVWQGFLRGPEEERALLAACIERIEAAPGLVSFFGKSFDRHRLEDRMRLHGMRPPFEGRPHLDLYHPCRRLYGSALPDGRLATMERALCGVARLDDLPGSLAPAAWLDFLHGRPHLLEEVFRHNHDDVLSLATLCAHLGSCMQRGAAATGPEGARVLALGKLHCEQRRFEQALPWLERAEELGSCAREAAYLRAQALRRLARDAQALQVLLELGDGSRDAWAARALLLAAHFSLRAGALEQARELDERGRSLLAVTITGTERARLETRSESLRRRLARKASSAAPAPGGRE